MLLKWPPGYGRCVVNLISLFFWRRSIRLIEFHFAIVYMYIAPAVRISVQEGAGGR